MESAELTEASNVTDGNPQQPETSSMIESYLTRERERVGEISINTWNHRVPQMTKTKGIRKKG